MSLQEYDPDLPPELAAATGIHDAGAENTNSVKSDIGQSDIGKVSGRVRPPLVCLLLTFILHFHMFYLEKKYTFSDFSLT